MNRVRVLDLFSGIGGFSLGLERAGMRTVGFCEIDPYCRAVLKKHWPHVEQTEDIQTRSHRPGEADLIAAGFPCQGISLQGYGAGLEDERSGLWSEALRAVRVVRPKYALLENVAALLDRGLGQILADLAALGYDTEWHCIPASCVGLPHARDRIWIVAYDSRQRKQGQPTPTLSGLYRIPWVENERRATLWRERPDLYPPHLCGRGYGIPERLDALGNAVTPLIPEIIGREIMKLESK